MITPTETTSQIGSTPRSWVSTRRMSTLRYNAVSSAPLSARLITVVRRLWSATADFVHVAADAPHGGPDRRLNDLSRLPIRGVILTETHRPFIGKKRCQCVGTQLADGCYNWGTMCSRTNPYMSLRV